MRCVKRENKGLDCLKSCRPLNFILSEMRSHGKILSREVIWSVILKYNITLAYCVENCLERKKMETGRLVKRLLQLHKQEMLVTWTNQDDGSRDNIKWTDSEYVLKIESNCMCAIRQRKVWFQDAWFEKKWISKIMNVILWKEKKLPLWIWYCERKNFMGKDGECSLWDI